MACYLPLALSKSLTCMTACFIASFNTAIDCYLKNIVDHPCIPGFNNNLDVGDYFTHGGHCVMTWWSS